jgi:nucleoside-diphosphate-sugar epimerase
LLGVWSHPDYEFRLGDVRDCAARSEALEGIDAVAHLAAIVGDPACARDPGAARGVNLDASLALFEDARRMGVSRFLFASTCSNYGKMADADGYVDETSELRPVSLYAETKVAVEKYILCERPLTDPLCATSLRLATVYGVSPRMRFDLTVNEFTAEMVAKGRLVVFGEQFWRPYVHVRDVARAVRLIIEAPASSVNREVFNIGSTPENYRKQDLVDLIRPEAPGAAVEYVKRAEDPRDYRVCFEKVRTRLGFTPSRTVPDGIREVAGLFRNQIIRSYEDPCYKN